MLARIFAKLPFIGEILQEEEEKRDAFWMMIALTTLQLIKGQLTNTDLIIFFWTVKFWQGIQWKSECMFTKSPGSGKLTGWLACQSIQFFFGH